MTTSFYEPRVRSFTHFVPSFAQSNQRFGWGYQPDLSADPFKKGWNPDKIYHSICTFANDIQQQLAENGSPRATFETNEERSYMLTFIPVHEAFAGQKIFGDKDEPQDVPNNVPNNVPNLSDRQSQIIQILKEDSSVSASIIAKRLDVATKTIKRDMAKLVELGVVCFVGPSHGGHWEITE